MAYHTRILTKTPRCDHISEVLVSLHWLRIEQRIVYKILALTYKAFVDHSAPVYLSELLNEKSISANTRSTNDDFLLVIPPISTHSKKYHKYITNIPQIYHKSTTKCDIVSQKCDIVPQKCDIIPQKA